MAARLRSVFFLIAALLVAVVTPRPALAWVDLTVARDDIRVTIDEAGQGIVEHAILILVAGGPLTELTISGVDADAEVLDGAHLVRDGGAGGAKRPGEDAEEELPISAKRVETKTGTDLVLTIDEGTGVRRGRYWVHVTYRTDLHKKALRVEGPRAIVEWAGPTWDYGLETTRAAFVLPSSRTEPTVHEGVDTAGSFIPAVRAMGRQVELTLVRPYASRGERVVWPVSFDARVLARRDAAPAAEVAAAPSSAKRAEVRQARWEFAAGSLAAFVLTFALVWAHGREADARARARGSRPAPLVPWPTPIRALLAAAFFGGGVWLTLCEGAPVYGAVALVSSIVFVLHRNAIAGRALRKPGAWLFVRKEEAFLGAASAPRELFDLRSGSAKLLFAGLLALFGGVAYALSKESIELAVTTALAVTPLCMLFATGDRRHQRPDLTYDVLPLFQRVISRVEKKVGASVRIATRLRMPEGSQDADELRVVFMPDRVERGLRSIELAMEPHSTGLGTHLRPVLLVRLEADSPALERAKKASYASRIVTGRTPTERVVVLSPKLPTVRVTAELVLAVVGAMTANRPAQVPVAGQPAQPPPSRRKPPVKAQPVEAPPVDDFEETRSIPVPKRPAVSA